MAKTADRFRRLAGAFTDKVAAVPPDRWDSPSPCEDWTAREVVGHVVGTYGMFQGMVGRDLGDIPSVDDDPLGAWTAARDVVQADLDDPERATQEFDGFAGRNTFEGAVDRFACMDLIVHNWDLSRATGLDEQLDPADVQRVREDAKGFGDMLRSPGVCGPAIDPPPGASEQDKMLAFLGRRV
jgi:uncharacterized protein (TIGR03086 family)